MICANKEDILHEMKAIATIHKFIVCRGVNENGKRKADSVMLELMGRLVERSLALIDSAFINSNCISIEKGVIDATNKDI